MEGSTLACSGVIRIESKYALFANSKSLPLDKIKKKEFLENVRILEHKIGNSPEYIQTYCDFLNGAL